MFRTSAARVPRHTRSSLNARIRRDTEERVRYYAHHPELIGHRLEELDREWDVERALEANAASLALAGVGLGAFLDRRFLALPAVVTGFLLQHALQGWCPPLPLLRRKGFRTPNEIERERAMLRALRGDFDELRAAGRERRDPSESSLESLATGNGR